jgi:hypothetical protein
MKKIVIQSDFDLVTTSYIIQHLDNSTRFFQVSRDEVEHSYKTDSGRVYAHLVKTSEGDILRLTFERERPTLKVVSGGQS